MIWVYLAVLLGNKPNIIALPKQEARSHISNQFSAITPVSACTMAEVAANKIFRK